MQGPIEGATDGKDLVHLIWPQISRISSQILAMAGAEQHA